MPNEVEEQEVKGTGSNFVNDESTRNQGAR